MIVKVKKNEEDFYLYSLNLQFPDYNEIIVLVMLIFKKINEVIMQIINYLIKNLSQKENFSIVAKGKYTNSKIKI